MDVPEQRIWTAEEMERLSPTERRDIVRAGFEKDLSNVSPDLLGRARGKIEARIASSKGTTNSDR